MKYKCSICGKEHNALPLDMAYHRPADYFKVPRAECADRIWFDAETNPDLCVIDNFRFYIRGVLAVPIQNVADEFRWGTWAEVEEQNFNRYLEL